MECLTAEKSVACRQYKDACCRMANSNGRGILSVLVFWAGTPKFPLYDNLHAEVTGFTNEEYLAFEQEAIQAKEASDISALKNNSTGVGHMPVHVSSGNYIAYISKTSDFRILHTIHGEEVLSLSDFIQRYNNLLITLGSDFDVRNSNDESLDFFHNRGISRNPYWVFKKQYAGLSMLLHAFTGAVAHEFFPSKKFLTIRPVGSMACILKKYLKKGDGYVESVCSKDNLDITDKECSKTDPECQRYYILTTALVRLYYDNKTM
jgi:hypothetical protein